MLRLRLIVLAGAVIDVAPSMCQWLAAAESDGGLGLAGRSFSARRRGAI